MIYIDGMGEKFGPGNVFCPVNAGIAWKSWPGKKEGQERWLKFTCMKTLPAVKYVMIWPAIMPYRDYKFKWPEVPEDCDVTWRGEQKQEEVIRDSWVEYETEPHEKNGWSKYDYARVLEYRVHFMASGDCKWSKEDIISILEHFNNHAMYTTPDCFRKQKTIGSDRGRKRARPKWCDE